MAKDKKKITIEDAKKWYNSFLNVLRHEGIDFNNPYALNLVKIHNDIMEDPESSDLNKIYGYIDNVNNSFTSAFIKTDKKGQYVNKKPQDMNIATWIENNTMNPLTLKDEDILKLYKLALDDKLSLRTAEFQSEDKITAKQIYVNDKGTCSVTKTLSDNALSCEEILTDAGFEKKRMGSIIEYWSKYRNATFNKSMYVTDTLPDRANEGVDYTLDTFMADQDRMNKANIENGIVSLGATKPNWLDTDEKKNTNLKCFRYATVLQINRTNGQTRYLTEHQNASPVIKYIESSLMSMFNPNKDVDGKRIIEKNMDDILRLGVIKDMDGNPYPADSYESTLKIASAVTSNGGIIINDKVYALQGEYGFKPGVNRDNYHTIIDNIVTTFNDTIDPKLLNPLKKVESDLHNANHMILPSESIDRDIRRVISSANDLLNTVSEDEKIEPDVKTNLTKFISSLNKVHGILSDGILSPSLDDFKSYEVKKEVKNEVVNNRVVTNSNRYHGTTDSNRKAFQGQLTNKTSGMYAGSPLVQVALISDCKRIFKYNPETGKVEYPLYNYQADKKYSKDIEKHYEILNKVDLNEVLRSGNYYYIEPGKSTLKVLKDGVPKDFNINEVEDDKLRIALEGEISKHHVGPTVKREEIREREAELFTYDMKRTNGIFADLFGSKVGPTGNDNFRDFTENINFALNNTGRDYNYPEVSDLSEDDIVALTSLSFALKDISPNFYTKDNPEANAMSVYEMWSGDLFIERSGKTSTMLSHIENARSKVKDLLERYKESKDETILSDFLKDTLNIAANAGNLQSQFTNQSVGQLAPSHFIEKFIEHHPNVVKIARESLKSDNEALKKFDDSLRKIVNQEKAYSIANKANDLNLAPMDREPKHVLCGLLNHESDFYSNHISLVQTKRLRSFTKEHENQVDEAIKNGDMDKVNDLTSSYMSNLGFNSKDAPSTPLRALLEDGRAEAFLTDFVKLYAHENDSKNIDYDFLHLRLENMGILPKRPVYERIDDRVKPTEKNIELADKYYKEMEEFDPKKAMNNAISKLKKIEDINSKLKLASDAFLSAEGLTFTDAEDLATNMGISTQEYILNAMESNQKAEWDLLTNEEKLNSIKAEFNVRNADLTKESCKKICEKVVGLSELIANEPEGKEKTKLEGKLGDLALQIGKSVKNNRFDIDDPTVSNKISDILKKGDTFKREMEKKVKEVQKKDVEINLNIK